MSAIDIFNAIKDAVADIPLDADTDPAGEKLFETVILSPNKQLAKQLAAQFVFKSRVCLIVPLSIQRTIVDRNGSVAVLGAKLAEVDLVYSDRSYFGADLAVPFGSDKNLGLFAFDEKLEAALTGREISAFGPIIPGDSDPIVLTESDRRDAPGREAWMMQLFVPIGDLRYAVG